MVMEDLHNCLTSSCSCSSSSSARPDPFSIGTDLWLMAEQRTQEILCTVQPNVLSDHLRNQIIDYIRRLISVCGVEVFPFGSVPLKTYLPDGDIDLTALCYQNAEEDLASTICSILQSQQINPEFQVKDVQYIQAQVKVVKCTVKNIPVDISFNQTAGLCALCFLEHVDQLIGKNHLFKRSIILIKSWCYYESRILGAHHGLLSTYALEMMVLYVFNIFNSSLFYPLSVLFRFLDYYSAFDWDNYCVTINGPVTISSFTETGGIPENDGNNLLLSKEFWRCWKLIFSVPAWAVNTCDSEFPIKHLNILDPLKDDNNLGRSVSKGNSHRIRCAFSYGAQRLKAILMQSAESIGIEVERFFINTLDRNGRGQRPDVRIPIPAFGTARTVISHLRGDYHSYYHIMLYSQWYRDHTANISRQSGPQSTRQVQNHNAFYFLDWMVANSWHYFSMWHPDSFLPRPPLVLQNATQPVRFGVAEIRRSRGTGTFIPCPNNEALPLQSGRSRRGNMPRHSRNGNHESTSRLLPGSHQNSNHVDVHTGTDEHGTGSECNVSLGALSLHQDTNTPSSSSGVHQSHEPTLASSQTKDSSHSSNGSFGTYGYSPSPLGLPAAILTKLTDVNEASTSTSACASSVPTVGIQKQDENLSVRDKETVRVHPNKVGFDKEFPPLSCEYKRGEAVNGNGMTESSNP